MDKRFKRKKLINELLSDDIYVPMKRKELAMFMQVSEDAKDEFDSLIDEMIEAGEIVISKTGKLVAGKRRTKKSAVGLSESTDCNENKRAMEALNRAVKAMPGRNAVKLPGYTGTFIGNQRGFGFVTVEGMDNDFFIPEGMGLNAVNNDTVEIEVYKEATSGSRAEARVVRIIERSKDCIVGTYEASKGFGFVVPDNNKLFNDIFVPKERSKGAVSGSKVIVEIDNYGDKDHKPEGHVTKVIGHVNDPGVDILSIILAFGIPCEYPEKVLNQAERLSVPVSLKDMDGRSDLRNVTMVTIDGEDAKDLDDAVSLETVDGKYRLGVHIADVSNYVQENSALDREAYKRGTSVYLADRVVPMLPHALSNGICSLNAGEDRLALSCIMDIDSNGVISDYNIVESVVNIDKRLSYNVVKAIIEDNNEDVINEYSELSPMLIKMNELAHILRDKRKKRGSIDFDIPETKVILDEDGIPTDIKPYDRNEATKMIEDFMLAANETVATHFYWQEIPFLYRVHESPNPEKLEKLKTFIRNFGLHLKTNNDDIHPKEFQKLLERIEGTPEELLISRITLRSMQRACYSTSADGHFGLACEYYSHFTSPIRRYPDLQIHRIIKDSIRGRLNSDKLAHYESILPEVAKETSRTERRAEEAERETVKLKKAQYMLNHIHEIYDGVISGVTNWGIYVELENTVEGLIHVSTLDGFFRYDESSYSLINDATNVTYTLGQKIRIMVNNVDMLTRAVDFIVADFEEDSEIHNWYKSQKN